MGIFSKMKMFFCFVFCQDSTINKHAIVNNPQWPTYQYIVKRWVVRISFLPPITPPLLIGCSARSMVSVQLLFYMPEYWTYHIHSKINKTYSLFRQSSQVFNITSSITYLCWFLFWFFCGWSTNMCFQIFLHFDERKVRW